MRELIDSYLNFLETNKVTASNTIQAYQNDLNKFYIYIGQEISVIPNLGDVNQENILLFLKKEEEAGYQNSTLTRRQVSIRRFAKYLTLQGLLDSNDFCKIKSIKGSDKKPGDTEIRLLSFDELACILKVLSSSATPHFLRDKAIFLLLLETGMSVGKLTSVSLSDVYSRKGFLYIQEIGYYVPIPESFPTIDHYIRKGRPDLSPVRMENALFISQMGSRISRQSIWQVIQSVGTQCCCVSDLTPRQIRYTAVSKMLEKNYSVEKIQAYLGHSSFLSTRAFIQRLEDSKIKKEYDA
ncbi:MAG: tyrosine-type recombinase/integrase [Anaerolineales bacterium]|nr:tyrosine-type recombinase/integrase [Anaerolineales bacterium]